MEDQNLKSANENQSPSGLTISESAMNYLTETGKWTKFLSILGFIFIGLIVFMALFLGTILSSLTGGQMDNWPNGMQGLFGGLYLIMGIVYFFPTFYLWKFSQKLKLAISTQNSNELNAAFSNQKSFYKFWGIFIIVAIGIYIVIGVIAFVLAAIP